MITLSFSGSFRYFSNRATRSICASCQALVKDAKSGTKDNRNAVSIGTEAKVSTSDTNTSTQRSKVNGTTSPPPPSSLSSSSVNHDTLQEVLFFPDTSLVTPSVREGGGFNAIQSPDYPYSSSYLSNHPSDGPFSRLLKILKSAKKSLDVCIYVLSFPPLADVLLELFEKPVSIRIIVDGREDEAWRSQVSRLSRRGVQIRCNEKSYSILMHNKFAVIDSKIALTGSLNWTKSAVLLNYDNVLVTSTPALVTRYEEQFNNLWSHFKPYGTTTSGR